MKIIVFTPDKGTESGMHRDEVVCTKYYLTENGLLYIYDNNRVVEVFNDRGWLRLIVTDE